MKRTALSRGTNRIRPVSKKKAKKRASSDGKAAFAYVGQVKQLPCAVCGAYGPSDAHHVFHDRYGSRKASDWDVIPLCKEHHQDGPRAIHNGKETWRQIHGADWSYIEQTRRLVGEM